ncbi:hypothetical protein QBC39DRAFT_364587 [Podospora conica]|nr:hypothetical protein QBC39DRAFT_364587 [Schizothecium conicum]
MANQTAPDPSHPSPSSYSPDLSYGMPYASAGYPYQSAPPVPAGNFESSWSPSFTSATNDPTMSRQIEIQGLEWGDYSQPQINGGGSSVNASPVFSMADTNTWDQTHYNDTRASPYSDTATLSNTSNTLGSFSSAPMPAGSRHSTPGSHHPVPPPPISSPTARRQDTSKKRKTSSADGPHPNSRSAPKQQPQLKPSRPKLVTAAAPKAAVPALEQQLQDRLVARLGPSILPKSPADGKDARTAGDYIRREAWQRCQAEAQDMAQRRLRLLEHDRDAQERVTQRLLADVRALREAAAQNHEDLEGLLGAAKKLERGGG